MTPEHYERLCQLFEQAQQRPLAERAAYLDEVCGNDPALRAEVEELLAHDQRAREQHLFEEPCPLNAKVFLPTGSASAEGCESAMTRDQPFRDIVDEHLQPQPALVGEISPALGQLGHYELLAELGRGGMGTVYQAKHRLLHRVVAVKVLPPERVQDAMALARFRREMEAIGKLDHPNLVRATDAGEAHGKYFLVMEFLEGSDLGKFFKAHGPLPVSDACELVRQAALGLQHAYEHGLVHRDIKPSNLLLTRAGQVKVLDLGLALLRTRQSVIEELTATGQIMGTPDYMAPEQWDDSHTVDIRADLYSLGCTLYHLLTGCPPFAGPEYPTSAKKMLAHAQAAVPPVHVKRPDVPGDLAAVLEQLLAKEPEQRYATAAEVAVALQPFTHGCDLRRLIAGTAASPVSSFEPAAPNVGTPVKPVLARPSHQSPNRSRITLGALAIVTLLTLAMAVGLIYWFWAFSTPTPLALERLVLTAGRAEEPFRHPLVVGGAEQRMGLEDPLRPGEGFKLEGRFNRPTYWYLLWLDTAGAVEVETYSRVEEAEVEYPVGNELQKVNETDPPGTHLLLLVAGSMPPERACPLLRTRLTAIGKPPRARPRGAGERLLLPGELPETYLKRVDGKLPPGMRRMYALFFDTVK